MVVTSNEVSMIQIMLTVLLFFAAVLYSSVGHAGASGYLAVMSLFGIAPEVMKPTALVLNIAVASLATYKFYRAGFFQWRLFWPFAVCSVPLAYLGGSFDLSAIYYKPLLGTVLLLAAGRLLLGKQDYSVDGARIVPIPMALGLGGMIGFLSGLTGVGGGIFLSPLLLFSGWASIRQASGVTAAFILVNSIAGLLGNIASVSRVPIDAVWWLLAAVGGGWIGAELGARRLKIPYIKSLLGVVLVIAGLKMIVT
jgi:uncharacterized membrane protein YfcA